VDVFGGDEAAHHAVAADDSAAWRAWRTPGTHYHAGLPAGDNTLTMRLVAAVVSGVAERGGFDVEDHLQRHLYLLTAGRKEGANNDLWVDESHRVLVRNMATARMAPYEAGLNDCCLTGLSLATPLCLAYARNRDTCAVATRTLLQLTHKSEDQALQAQWWGDLLAELLAVAATVSG